MLYVENQLVPGTETATIKFYGEAPATAGVAEVAPHVYHLDDDRFYAEPDAADATGIIPIIGDEKYYRGQEYERNAGVSLASFLKSIEPAGLITFGINSRSRAETKPYGTHIDIMMREIGKTGLCAAVQGIYYEQRTAVITHLTDTIGSSAVALSRKENELHISLAS